MIQGAGEDVEREAERAKQEHQGQLEIAESPDHRVSQAREERKVFKDRLGLRERLVCLDHRALRASRES